MDDPRKSTEDESRPEDSAEGQRVKRYDRMAWLLFTLPTMVVFFFVFSRSCSGSGG